MFREYSYWSLVVSFSSSKQEYIKLQKLNLRAQEIPAVHCLVKTFLLSQYFWTLCFPIELRVEEIAKAKN